MNIYSSFMSMARKYSFRSANNFPVSESSETADSRSYCVCYKIFNGKARSDKYAEKLYIPKPDKIDEMNKLQKFHQKCEKQHADMNYIMIVFSAENTLKKAIDRPDYYRISRV